VYLQLYNNFNSCKYNKFNSNLEILDPDTNLPIDMNNYYIKNDFCHTKTEEIIGEIINNEKLSKNDKKELLHEIKNTTFILGVKNILENFGISENTKEILEEINLILKADFDDLNKIKNIDIFLFKLFYTHVKFFSINLLLPLITKMFLETFNIILSPYQMGILDTLFVIAGSTIYVKDLFFTMIEGYTFRPYKHIKKYN